MPPLARVLAVDDNAVILEMVTNFLTLQGYEVLTASTFSDALMLLTAVPTDIVLLDMGLSDADAVTSVRQIRAGHPDVPVIMVTGTVDPELTRDTLLKAGAFDSVTKPVDFEHLARVIETAIGRRQK